MKKPHIYSIFPHFIAIFVLFSVFWVSFLGLVAVFPLFPLEASAQSDVKPVFFFLRNLKQGDTGQDVLELQKLLNTDPDTSLAGPGLGSKGNESTYFGPKTRESVMRFQNKYSADVLRPAGLSVPSGAVDIWTRMKINQILLKVTTGQIPAPKPNDDTTNTQDDDDSQDAVSDDDRSSDSSALIPVIPNVFNDSNLNLTGASLYASPAGSEITLTGSGFSKASQVRLGKKYTVKSPLLVTAGKIVFEIPESVVIGRYDMTVTSGTGQVSNPLPFMVTRPGAIPPVVEKVEPSVAKFGQEIKITGKNFSARDNIVSTSAGIVRGLKSTAGTEIRFSLPLPDFLKGLKPDHQALTKKDNIYWPVSVMVVNENGISTPNSVSQFIINI